MSLIDKLRPVNSNHSIKEAVISLFLAAPIIKADRFRGLIDNEFKDKFQRFDPVMQVQFQLKNLTQLPLRLEPPEIQNNVGFKFTSFESGSPSKVLQGQNDNLNLRTFISFHYLNYTRWKPFLADWMDVIRIISNHNNDIFITGVSLHYIDQFFWIGNLPIDLKIVFNKSSTLIPDDFFAATINNYSMVTQKQISPGTDYLDRLEITIDNYMKPSITISHNVTQPISEVISLADLIEGEKLLNILRSAHEHNKSLLKNLFENDVLHLINLT